MSDRSRAIAADMAEQEANAKAKNAVSRWRCPKCHGEDLRVAIASVASLDQDGDGNFQTDIDVASEHEWTESSLMLCADSDCDFQAPARCFDTEAQNVHRLVMATCSHCGSEDVQADAYVKWNKLTQEWEIVSTFDKGAHCDKCDGETSIEFKPREDLTHE